MQIGNDVEAKLHASIRTCAGALAELDTALHSMNLVSLQGKLADSMASQVVLLRDLAQEFYGTELPEDPVKLQEALEDLRNQPGATPLI
ncbi:hypothetical protein [Paracoccus laeviglucosivorans]|nr:hypothetical protein [Paracoccus laeviglucosivorans]